MTRVHMDFIRSNKRPKSGTHYTNIVIDERQPVPSVDDTVVLFKGKRTSEVRIERRTFYYLKDSVDLQLYFVKAG